jgi:glycerophosphoryl diester phosphodiesterase
MVKILAHRGGAGLEPENTIRAFKRALDLGVDLIEFDVRLTKDKKLVVIHDEKVDRTTNGRGYVRDLTLDEIRKLNIAENEKIPTLEEVINLLKTEKPIIVIEIKEPETTEKILKAIKNKRLENKVLIVSFWPDVLKKIKEIAPKIKTGILIGKGPVDAVSMVKDLKADFFCPRFDLIDKKTVENCHQNNIKINVWTVNKPEDIEKMIKSGVDIISSDYPNLVLEKLKKL